MGPSRLITMLLSRLWTPSSPPLARSTPNDAKMSYEELRLGIWRVLVVKDSHFSMFNFRWENISSALPLLRRALYDVYIISPRLFALRILAELWFAIEDPLSFYFSNTLFFSIEKKITGGSADTQTSFGLYTAVVARVICSVLSAYMSWLLQQNKCAYSSRIRYAYEARVFSAKLAFDLPTSEDDATSNFDIDDVYECLNRGITTMKDTISFLLHIRLFIHVIGTSLSDGGPVYLAICMLQPFMRHFMSKGLWTKAYFVDAMNKHFIRKSTLEKFLWDDLKEEVIAGGIDNYLLKEYRDAKDGLGDTPDIGPEWLYDQRHEALSDIIMTLCSDAPTVRSHCTIIHTILTTSQLYFAYLALTSRSKLTMTQFAVLNQASSSLSYTLASIGLDIDLWPSCFSRMRNVYTALDTKNKMKDGETTFPRPGREASTGVGIEFRDVSFSYPNSKSERASLSGVSFTIQPGQLVVIVGTNGSGKSTIIKLLSRFYEPTSGSILIDGIPIEEYCMAELRKGIAMLTQEHQLFPLSIGENIKLGSSNSEAVDNQQKIEEAVSAADAESIVKGFSDGYDTVLEPVRVGYLSYAGQGNEELETIQKNLQKPTNISGDARTFMRLFTSPIKLVTVDEPSSALDPEAEHRLFGKLRQERKGRTMIFITHRFGHLTKHADLIICIKEGAVVETGTHTDLLSRGGEYAHLYNIQAQAFATT
ncbi:P-loop containing nucleoside triphosphate hydrolase protein [Boletus reticuloceps]|uniref:P-loop containing nucleoside triphosphate hydrolase protein n=1 Tax=Boletus reticuloceps TaxID=495285 RepID=A0A8I2YKU6_9AGAM|nr:P-loop containing nucleoside triphosphate hydrolase protein [Boletus reticuloceps]KAG6380025.1 P-loop containing nucleoside triphosphate hydrolase protein [Boletus reticuloceps]